MSIKNKNRQSPSSETITQLARQTGIILMAAAATVGLLEPDRFGSRIVLPNQPVLATMNAMEQFNNPLRREREETAPHYISYSVAQRTPARSGKY